ncbi:MULTISPECIES: hypothetical protein [Sphingobacterium]|uniref:hypothetical protein n=1 Tax=Sphingobacterium TaxID=28453 RepID=UPI000E00CF97|nr:MULTISPECIES: hypothetical protein [Sphingobacterium]QQT43239.1 hypothetical protein I6J00_15920 [Sphingobacterium multivorum]SUI99042.1 Uncharacterised protein [Sphingobacterium multivorum]
MKTINYTLIFSIFLSLFIFLSCSKDEDNSFLGTYFLVKKGIVKDGKFIEENDDEEITSEITFFSDKSFRIVSNTNDKGSVSSGTYDIVKKQCTMQDEDGNYYIFDYYFDRKYLVIVTEYNDAYNEVGYFLKK